MGLLVGSSDTIRVPLHVKITDGDDVIDVKFTGVYKRTTKSIRKARSKSLIDAQRKQAKIATMSTDGLSDEDVEQLIDDQFKIGEEVDTLQFKGFVGWSGLKGKGGKAIKFSDKALEEMLESDPYRLGILDGLRRSNGVVDQKN